MRAERGGRARRQSRQPQDHGRRPGHRGRLCRRRHHGEPVLPRADPVPRAQHHDHLGHGAGHGPRPLPGRMPHLRPELREKPRPLHRRRHPARGPRPGEGLHLHPRGRRRLDSLQGRHHLVLLERDRPVRSGLGRRAVRPGHGRRDRFLGDVSRPRRRTPHPLLRPHRRRPRHRRPRDGHHTRGSRRRPRRRLRLLPRRRAAELLRHRLFQRRRRLRRRLLRHHRARRQPRRRRGGPGQPFGPHQRQRRLVPDLLVARRHRLRYLRQPRHDPRRRRPVRLLHPPSAPRAAGRS